MKRLILCVSICSLWIGVAMGQARQTKSKPEKQPVQKTAVVKKKQHVQSTASEQRTILSSTSNYNAFATPFSGNRYSIADPYITTFNARSVSGADATGGKAIIGIPKINHGIGRGRILFYSASAPTFGTSTGSGSVGTGSSLGNVGTNGVGLGVNGKNPYAGPGIYGTRVLNDLRDKRSLSNQ